MRRKKRDSAVHEDIGGLEHGPTAVHHIDEPRLVGKYLLV